MKLKPQSIDNFFSNKKNISITKNLIQELKIKDYIIQSTDGKFSNQKLMFTGGFENMSRTEAKTIVENNGGKVLGTISKKLDYLVVGNSKPTMKKVDLAKKLKVKIIFEKEWNKILKSSNMLFSNSKISELFIKRFKLLYILFYDKY